ncbi:MAG: hypothetical protein IIB56_00660 [Planctomycetes bacterium]|nr:hypothetical protein [Planctomycetota bacterium]
MKRLVCLLVIVSIAYAGCADKKPSKVTVISGLLDGVPDGRWDYPEDGSWESPGVLRFEIANMHKQNEALRVRVDALVDALEDALAFQGEVERPEKLLLVRIADLEAALESQREVERAEKALLVRTAKLEAVLESQRAVIENLKKIHQLHETTLEYQRSALVSSLKLCRLYEAKIESQREVVKDCGFRGTWRF